jgi:hypothetical protein
MYAFLERYKLATHTKEEIVKICPISFGEIEFIISLKEATTTKISTLNIFTRELHQKFES